MHYLVILNITFLIINLHSQIVEMVGVVFAVNVL